VLRDLLSNPAFESRYRIGSRSYSEIIKSSIEEVK